MSGQVSLKSIAEKCGLSVSTVSQILNNRPNNYSSEEVKSKVKETARQMGYRPNFAYKLMRGQKTRTVAIFVSMSHKKTEEHTRELLVSLMGHLDRIDYASYFSIMGNNAEDNINRLREFLVRGVEHFIILGSPVGHLEMEKMIEDAGKLMVSTSMSFKRWIVNDSVGAAAQVMRFLHDRSGENFRFVSPGPVVSGQLRSQSLMRVFPELDFEEIHQRYIRQINDFDVEVEDYPDAAYRAGFSYAKILFSEEPGIKAVCCNTDLFALGIAGYLVKAGKIIGKDVMLGGFNNDFGVRNFPFPISSVDHDCRRLSRLLVETALSPGECRMLLEPKVYIRE